MRRRGNGLARFRAAYVSEGLVPTRPEDPAAEANRAAWEVLTRWDKPFLTRSANVNPVLNKANAAWDLSSISLK